ncbi:MAG: restriction endonuclease subunit S [Chloroflexota bacterium]
MMEGWKLPEGWDFATLSEPKVRILSGFSCARKNVVSEGLLHLRPFNIGINGEIDLSNCLYIPEGFVNNPTDFWLESGDILFNNTNSVELVGKSAIVRTNLPCAFSNHLTRIRVIDRDYLEPQWILVFLRYLWQTGFFAAHCNRWIGQAGYAPSKLTELSLPRPPIAEQRRIVARLEALLGEVKALREQAQTLRCDVNRLMESALAEVFPEINTTFDTKHWTFVPVERICTKPQYGYTATSETQPIGPKFLRITDIQDGNVNWDNVPYCRISSKRIVNYLLSDGDILFARSGATTGKTYIVKNSPQAVFASYLIRIRVTEPNLPEYVYWYFQSPQYWKQLTIRGGAQPNMNAQLLRKVLVPIPDPLDENNSLVEQRRIVAYLDGIQEEVREAQKLLEADLRAIEQLEQSILAAAFRGEI